MAAGDVRLSDVVKPLVFRDYFNQLIIEKSTMVRDGVIVASQDLRNFLAGPGESINFPFWNPIDVTDVENSSTDDPAQNSVPNKKDAADEATPRINRNNSWSEMSLVKHITASSPMQSIINDLVDYWLFRKQQHILSILKGVFAANVTNDSGDMLNDVYNIAGGPATQINRNSLIDATHTNGDRFDEFTDVFMHSDVHKFLSKENQIETVKPSENDKAIRMYEEMIIHIDDTMPKDVPGGGDADDYTTYIFGRGSFSGEEGIEAPEEAFEVERKESAGKGGGQTILHNRIMYALHPNGHKYNLGVAGANPENATNEVDTTWTRVIERKKVRMAALRHTIG